MSEQNTSPSPVQLADTEPVDDQSSTVEAGQTDAVQSDAVQSDVVQGSEEGKSADSTDGKHADGKPADEKTAAADGSDNDGADEASELDTEAEVAADFLEEFLDIADLDGDIDTYIENGRAQVSIVTESATLVGKDGEVLEALQEIVRLAVMAETDNRTRLMLDVAGFREKRRVTLRALASDAVQEVQDSGESVRLAPMNPFERKIVHDTVAEAGLTSESEGTEPQRRVVVLPAK